MLLVGALSPVRAAILAVVQILGAITGAAIIDALTPGMPERRNSVLSARMLTFCVSAGTLNVRTKLTPGMSIARGLFLEATMTALLSVLRYLEPLRAHARLTDFNTDSMLAILLLAAEKSRGTFMAPLPIGLALFVAELASGELTVLRVLRRRVKPRY